MAFDNASRNALQRVVTECRKRLTAEFISQLQELYGIQPNGRAADLDTLGHLDDAQLETAALLRQRLAYLESNLPASKSRAAQAVDRLTREQAFTILNRLAALRMGEERGLVLECVRGGIHSEGFQLYQQNAGADLGETAAQYETYLKCLFDELSLDLGVLFDRFDPLGLLFPRPDALQAVIKELNGERFTGDKGGITQARFQQLFAGDEAIGWIYQYYNDPEERKKMRKESAAPRNSRELAVRNQFFTPRYVVEFLTDNTLGRIWYEMCQGRTRLKEQCRYLVRRPTEVFLGPGESAPGVVSGEEVGSRQRAEGSEENLSQEELLKQPVYIPHRAMKDPREIRLLDPACGSMHFGLYAFDLYESIYAEAWDLQVAVLEEAGSRQRAEGSEGHGKSIAKLSGPDRMEKSHGSGGPHLHDKPILPEGGTLRPDQPDSQSSRVDSIEHCGRPGPKDQGGVQASLVSGTRVTAGSGDPGHHRSSTGFHDSGPGNASPESGLGSGPPHSGTFQLLGQEVTPAEYSDYLHRLRTAGWNYPDLKSLNSNSPVISTSPAYRPLPTAYPSRDAFLKAVPAMVIEHNIHGVDIDPRAVQIAGLSLWLRAQKSWMATPAADRPRVQRSNIVCAEPMPGSDAMLAEFVGSLNPPLLGELVKTVFEKMQLSGEAGSLLKIEEEIRGAIEAAKREWLKTLDELPGLEKSGQWSVASGQQGKSTDHRPLTTDYWETVEGRLLDALRAYAEQADADSYQRRLFADDAARGFAFIDLCRKRYDAVVMNPPFGEATIHSTAGLKRYAIKNLYSCFVERAAEISHPDGTFAAITDSTYLKQPKFAELRQMLLGGKQRLHQIVDLGWGVLDANVRTALFVCHRWNGRGFDSLDVADRDDRGDLILEASYRSLFIERSHEETLSLPKSVLALNLPVESTGQLIALDRIQSLAELPWGCGANDAVRLFRLRWEVGNSEIGDAWAFLTNGGEFAPLYRENYFVCRVRVENGDSAFTTRFKNDTDNLYDASAQHLYYKPGLTYPKRSRFFHLAALPAGHIFTPEGKGFFLQDSGNRLLSLAILNSSVVAQMADFLCGPHKQRGDVELIGVPKVDKATVGNIERSAQRALSSLQSLADANEDSALFCKPWQRNHGEAQLDCLKRLVEEREGQIAQTSQIVAEAFLDFDAAGQEACPWLPLDEGCIDELRTARSKVFDSYALGAEAYVSYLVGCPFGRWDIRYATGERQPPELPDPFDPLPVCPPGMLQGDDGLPLSPKEGRRQRAEGGYPLDVVWSGILVDDENQPDDIVARVRAAMAVIWDGTSDQWPVTSGQSTAVSEPHVSPTDHRPPTTDHSSKDTSPTDHRPPTTDHSPKATDHSPKATDHSPKAQAIEAEACEILGVRSLRDYFRRPAAFFADHLKRYSKSRRQAPIYWPLSTESGTYTLWIYYHRLDDQILYKCLRDFVQPKLDTTKEDIKHLRKVQAEGELKPKDQDRLKDLESLEGELEAFKAELEHWAPRWKPNLNDGVQITAAPLWKLFRLPKWRKTLQDTWKKLEAGDYDWAHLAYSLWPDRVREKCKTDRSLAIAHSLEEICEVQPPEAKKKSAAKKHKKNKKEDLPGLEE